MVNQEQLKDLQQRINAIAIYLKIDEKRIQLNEAELKTQDPTFWNDPKKAEIEMKNIRTLTRRVHLDQSSLRRILILIRIAGALWSLDLRPRDMMLTI